MESYRDHQKSIEVRVQDLLGSMTLTEKIGQLGSVYANSLLEKQRLSAVASRGLLTARNRPDKCHRTDLGSRPFGARRVRQRDSAIPR